MIPLFPLLCTILLAAGAAVQGAPAKKKAPSKPVAAAEKGKAVKPSEKKSTASKPASKEKPAATPTAKKPSGSSGKDAGAPAKGKTTTAEKPAKPSLEEKPAAPGKAATPGAKTATLPPEKLSGFAGLPPVTQSMLRYSLELASRGLAYTPGSADPAAGGTDCSGFVYHVLQRQGITGIPRQSDHMYAWAWRAGTFRAFNGESLKSFELEDLRPGDLLFWTNSTRDGKTDRDPPVTHVMLYLGKRAADGTPLAIGASDGRTYEGQRMSGVSVFDFRLPSPGSQARFIGYAHVPGMSGK